MNDMWIEAARIDESLYRVECATRSRWFVRDGVEDPGGTWHSGRPQPGRVRLAEGPVVTGLLVSRCEGGRVSDLLRARGPLPPPELRAVLADAVAVLVDTPPAPPGRTRLHVDALGMDAASRAVAIPGLHRELPAADDDARALARLGMALLTGDPAMELGSPPGSLSPKLGAGDCLLLDELAKGAVPRLPTGGIDASALLARIAECGPAERPPFYPAEPGVPIAEAATGVLPAARMPASQPDPASLAFAAPCGTGTRSAGPDCAGTAETSGADGADAAGAAVAQLRKGAAVRTRGALRTPGTGQGRTGTRLSATRPTRTGRIPIARTFVIAMAGVLLVAGSALVVSARGAASSNADQESADSARSAAQASAGTTGQPASGSARSTAAGATAQHNRDRLLDRRDPAGAWAELTRLREVAYETADAAILRRLSVPGSPAARGEDAAALGDFRGSDVSLALSAVAVTRLAGDSASVECRQHTVVRSAAGTIDYGTNRLLAELTYGDAGWAASRIVQLER